jgi:hypothetical protein
MDFNDTPEEAAFRIEARAFVEQYATREDIRPPQSPERLDGYLARAVAAATGNSGAFVLSAQAP